MRTFVYFSDGELVVVVVVVVVAVVDVVVVAVVVVVEVESVSFPIMSICRENSIEFILAAFKITSPVSRTNSKHVKHVTKV